MKTCKEIYGEADFRLGGEIEKANKTFTDTKIMYNQDEVSKVSCTIHGSIGAVSDLTGYEFDIQERKNLWIKALEGGANSEGRYIYKAIDLVRHYWNKNNQNQIISYNVKLDSEEFYECLLKGYTVTTGYRGNRAYNLDKFDDCILQGTVFGDTTYGHCIRITQYDGNIYVVDNYDGEKCNIYELDDFKQLVLNGVFFKNGYIYNLTIPTMPEKIFPETLKTNDPEEIEIIKARKNELTPEKLTYKNYTDKYAINKMLNDLMLIRNKLI